MPYDADAYADSLTHTTDRAIAIATQRCPCATDAKTAASMTMLLSVKDAVNTVRMFMNTCPRSLLTILIHI